MAGYSGGQHTTPCYQDVKDHSEALLIEFDPNETCLKSLLGAWTKIDKPTTEQRQYRSFVGYLSEEQKLVAEQVVAEWRKRLGSSSPLYTSVEEATMFYQAEEYHQDYYLRTGQARFVQ